MASVTRPLASEWTFEEALDALSREERFMGTVSAMNSLLVKKGVYTTAEFQEIFVAWAVAQVEKSTRERPGQR
jgi:hypothetical protein